MNCNCENNKNTVKCNEIFTDKNCNLVITDSTFNCDNVQVFILKMNDEILQTIVREKRSQSIVFNKSKQDGFYTICKITIPKDEAMPYYYKDGSYYHNIRRVTLQEILNINPEVSKLNFEYLYYFSTCNLRKCFIKLCQQIFKQQTSICNKSNIDNSLTYKRDLVWSALNVIKYMTEMGQIEEAQRLLEEITACNGLCPPQTNSKGCGCL